MVKNILYTLFLFGSLAFAQSSGITYQAVIYNPAGEELPGVDNPYAPLTNQDVCLQFGIVDSDGNLEYQEQVQVTTDPFGMVNLLIGTNTQTGGYAADFANVQWTADAKFLVVDLDIKGTCNDFEELSNQPFTLCTVRILLPCIRYTGTRRPSRTSRCTRTSGRTQDPQELMDKTAQLELQDQVDQQGPQAHKVLLVQMDKTERLAQQDHKVPRV